MGKMISTCKKAVEIRGTVAQWETWTNMKFPVSGWYVVEGALCAIRINRERNLGIYNEPNVWVSHETLSNVE
jgi:hypothetical protein